MSNGILWDFELNLYLIIGFLLGFKGFHRKTSKNRWILARFDHLLCEM